MKSLEQAFLEQVTVRTTHWINKYCICIYDKITKSQISEYGLFDNVESAQIFATEHHVKLVKK
jgi:hypothetical protein